MGTILMFLGFLVLCVAIGLGFCVGFCAVYKSLKEKDYESAFLMGFFLLLLLSAILLLAGSLI